MKKNCVFIKKRNRRQNGIVCKKERTTLVLKKICVQDIIVFDSSTISISYYVQLITMLKLTNKLNCSARGHTNIYKIYMYREFRAFIVSIGQNRWSSRYIQIQIIDLTLIRMSVFIYRIKT